MVMQETENDAAADRQVIELPRRLVAPAAPDGRLVELRRRLYWTCRGIQIGAVLLAFWQVGDAIWPWLDVESFIARNAAAYGIDPISATSAKYWSALVINMTATLFVVPLSSSIFRLTQGFLAGEFFDFDTARRLRRIAFAGLAMAAADVAQRPMIYALVWPELFGKAPLFMPRDALLLVVSAFVFALATLFRAAAEVANEHRTFV